MSPGNVEFVQVLCQMVVVPGMVALIVRTDERRLRGARLEHAWPPVSRDAVIFATWQFGILFGCPALLVWFVRTRRSLVGALLGLGSALALLAAAIASALIPEAAIDWLGL